MLLLKSLLLPIPSIVLQILMARIKIYVLYNIAYRRSARSRYSEVSRPILLLSGQMSSVLSGIARILKILEPFI